MKIIKYSELSEFNELNELLPNEKDSCVILYEDSLDHGHWVALSKYNGIFELFESYGMSPDGELHWLNLEEEANLERSDALSQQPSGGSYIHIQSCQVSAVRSRGKYMRISRSIYTVSADELEH